MSYEEDYKEAKKAGEMEQISATFHQWEKPGSSIIGRFLHVNEVEGQRPGTHYNQYLFDTDAGRIKFHMGGATDNEAGALMKIGEVYHIEFKGQENMRGGNRVNKFMINRLPRAKTSGVGGDDDTPF